jgi:hypothetical protein
MKIDKYPQNLEQFVELRNQMATTPEGGLACFIIALREFALKGDEALPWMIVCRDINDLQESNMPTAYKGYTLGNFELSRLKSQLAHQKFLIDSYFMGSTPENNYSVPMDNIEFSFSSNKYSGDPAEGLTKIYVYCSGAATPRPSTMKRNEKGIWKVKEYSSLYVGIQGPASSKRVDDL